MYPRIDAAILSHNFKLKYFKLWTMGKEYGILLPPSPLRQHRIETRELIQHLTRLFIRSNR